jgi:hypothetical protein
VCRPQNVQHHSRYGTRSVPTTLKRRARVPVNAVNYFSLPSPPWGRGVGGEGAGVEWSFADGAIPARWRTVFYALCVQIIRKRGCRDMQFLGGSHAS